MEKRHVQLCHVSVPSVTPQNVMITTKCSINENVIRIATKCNTKANCTKKVNAKCNNFSTENVRTFQMHIVITQDVITLKRP